VIQTRAAIQEIRKKKAKFIVQDTAFDAVLFTVPSPIAASLGKFDKQYTDKLCAIPHLWAQTLILETTKPVLDKTYWLNINERNFPFLAVVQHTNLIDQAHYNGHHIVYIGNYLQDHHPYLGKTKEELLALFLPYLKKINPHVNAKFVILNSFLFTVPNAQPVHTCGYSKRAPQLVTPYDHVYLANLDSVYPWDRGTNYAVEFGKRAASIILQKESL